MNTHVTSPAATVALGLMYLKTNDRCHVMSCDVVKMNFVFRQYHAFTIGISFT